MLCVTLFNQSQEARGGVWCSLVGWLCLFQLQMMTKQNSNWKMKEITIYFGKQHLHEYGNVELVFVIIHSWWMIINSDRVVYNQSRGFSVPEDKLSRGTSQGELSNGWRSWGDKFQHAYTFLHLSHVTLI